MKVKKILLTLGIISISLIGVTYGRQQWFSNGLYNTTYSNLRNDTLNLYVPTNYAFYTTVGNNKYDSIYAIYDKIFFYWNTEGVLSIYNGVTEWHDATKGGLTLNKFYVCDYITGDFNEFTNCTEYDYDKDMINTYMKDTVNTDKIIYGDGYDSYNTELINNSVPFIAFSIEGIQKTILFYTPMGYVQSVNGSFIYGLPYLLNKVNYDVAWTGNYDITTFPDHYIGNSPINSNNDINYGNGIDENGNPCITFRQLFSMDNNKYNTGLCYSSNMIYSGGQLIQIQPKEITEIFTTYTDFRNDINLYNNYCKAPATTETCQKAFSGKQEARSIINKLPQETQANTLYDYCTTYQIYSGNLDKNTCDITDEEEKQIVPSFFTTEGYNEHIKNSNIEIQTPNTGSVFATITNTENRDIIDSRIHVYEKISNIFKNNTGQEGIIPQYITRIILIIILFKIFKK